jgi:hypothetical protein
MFAVVAIGALLAAGAVAFVMITSSGRATNNANTSNTNTNNTNTSNASDSIDAGVKTAIAPSTMTIDAAPTPTATIDAGAVATNPARDAAPVIKKPLGKGKLTVFAPDVQWARVYIDGNHVGETPLREYTVTAESHTVRVVCDPAVCGEERARSTTVTVRAGKITTVPFKLR